METPPNPEPSFEQACEATYQTMLANGVETFTELPESISPVDFLHWVVTKKHVLLHGSNNQSISVLNPRLANCNAKEFGNQEAVYAVTDPVLPTFYAIKDQERFTGTAESGVHTSEADDEIEKRYEFAVSGEALKSEPWSDGAVYILPRDNFVQGHSHEGEPIDEWASTVPVTPLGKIKITPDEFPYLDQIETLTE